MVDYEDKYFAMGSNRQTNTLTLLEKACVFKRENMQTALFALDPFDRIKAHAKNPNDNDILQLLKNIIFVDKPEALPRNVKGFALLIDDDNGCLQLAIAKEDRPWPTKILSTVFLKDILDI